MEIPNPGIKTRLLEAVTWSLENDKLWPETMRRPTHEEAIGIAKTVILVVAHFAQWAENYMKVEVDKVMTQIHQPMIGTLEDQKKAKPICEICKEDRSYQDWSDAVISFINPAEHYHLGCLQIRVRELEAKNVEREAVLEEVVFMLQSTQTDAVNRVDRGNIIDRVRLLKKVSQ